MKIIDQSARILRPTSPDDAIAEMKMMEYAGRNCYDSHHLITEDSYDGFVRRLISRKHYSPLEFGRMTVELVTGRDVMAEITRHRHAGFAIRSQRYVADNKTGEISFIRPNFWVPDGGDPKLRVASVLWEDAMADVESRYKVLKDLGLPNQDCRKILPNSAATVIEMEANLREWIHIFDLRTSSAAYPEMRTLMTDLLNQTIQFYPILGGESDGQPNDSR